MNPMFLGTLKIPSIKKYKNKLKKTIRLQRKLFIIEPKINNRRRKYVLYAKEFSKT